MKTVALLVANESVAKSFKSSIGGICEGRLSYFTLGSLNMLVNDLLENKISAIISYNNREQEINVKSLVKRLLAMRNGFDNAMVERYPMPPCLDLNGQRAEGLVTFSKAFSNTMKGLSAPNSVKVNSLISSGLLKRLKRNVSVTMIEDREERLVGIRTILSLIPEAKIRVIVPKKPFFPEFPSETEILFIEENMFFTTGEETKKHLDKIGFRGIIVSTTEAERSEFRFHLKGKSKIETDEERALQFCKALNALFKVIGAL